MLLFTPSPRSVVLLVVYHLAFGPHRVNTQASGPSWERYVRAPPSRLVKPKAILSEYTLGGVVNPDGLISGEEPTLLRRDANSTAAPTLVVDFGQNVVGLPIIEFAGSSNATSEEGFPGLQLYFSESLEFLGDRSDFTRSDNAEGDPPKIVPSGTDQVAIKSEPYAWIDQWGCEFGNQVCSDGLHGFRYLKITLNALSEDSPFTSAYGSVSIKSVALQWSGYLGTPDTYVGWFECSDEDLTQWWYDGSYTNEMCTDVFRANDTEPRQGFSKSLEGKLVIHDGPKRDRDPYMGDLAVSALTSYLTHDVPEAARNVMEDLAQHQRSDGWIPPASIRNYGLELFDYPLWWVACSWDLVMHTGNLSYIETYYPTLLSVLDTYYVQHTDNDTSLLLRQSGYGDYAFLPRDGSAAYYSALYVLALNRAAELAEHLGDRDDDAVRWRERASRVSQAFLDILWDPAAGAFYDRHCDGCTAHAQDGNSLAILSGIANTSYAKSSLAYLASSNARPWGNAFYDAGGEALGKGFSDRVYAFISYFEMAARFETASLKSNNTGGGSLDQLRRTYGWMSRHDPGSTFWEGIGAGGAKYQGAFTSLAHGWSTGVVPLLTNYVLGARPRTPGFAKWTVKPRPGDLDWARGKVPTPSGPLEVSWKRRGSSGGGIELRVRAPEGTSGVVSVPVATGDADGKRALLNGAPGLGVVTEDGYIEFEVQGGEEHVIGYSQAGESMGAL